MTYYDCLICSQVCGKVQYVIMLNPQKVVGWILLLYSHVFTHIYYIFIDFFLFMYAQKPGDIKKIH